MSGFDSNTVGSRSRTSRFSDRESRPVYDATETRLPNPNPRASSESDSSWSAMSAF
jgi:hypothetical protein